MKTKIFLTILTLLLIAGSAGTAYYFYTKYQTAQNALNNPEQIAKSEVKILLDKLGKFIELPTDEDPNVATVLDKDKLKDQAFFAKAENGDKVIIYTKAAKAILYRESTNKIIEVAPISMTQPEASTTPTPKAKATPEPTPEITTEPSPTN